MRTLFSLLWPKKSTTFDHLLPLEYWIHLQATWYSLHSSCVVRPRLLKGEMLISDGWYYKFAAKLKARGLSDAYIRTIFSHIAKPNLVVLLDGDIAGIWDRKKRFRHHEMGLHHNYARLGKESFVDYQSKIFRCLKLFATTTLWRVVKIDVSAPIDQNVDTVARSIENCLL